MKLKQLTHKMRNFFSVVLNDPLRKSIFGMTAEYLRYSITDADAANQYFSKFLYRKNAEPSSKYLVTDSVLSKCWGLNDMTFRTVVDDKFLFEEFFTNHKVTVATSLAHTSNTLFFVRNKILQVNTPEEFNNFLKSIIKKGSRSDSFILKKRSGSSGGKSIFRIDHTDLDKDTEKISRVYNEILKAQYIIQDFVVQHEEINRLNSHCLNTMRMDSFTNKDGKSRVYSAFIRMGLNHSHVDNIDSGGFFVGINLEDGTLRAAGASDFTHGRAKSFTVNPETNIAFKGYHIPYFSDAVELVCKAASLIPRLKILGWDVAIGPDGPVIIEANETPGINFSELSQDGFATSPVFRDILQEINEKEIAAGRGRMKEKRIITSAAEPLMKE